MTRHIGLIAPRQDVAHTLTEAYADAEIEFGEMLKRAAHKRRCHMLGHRGCRFCKPTNCRHCHDERFEAWERNRYSLSREADELLRANGHDPRNVVAPDDSDDDLLILLLLMK